MPLTVGSLFSGIGGFDLGFQNAGFQIEWRCEVDAFCRRILSHRMPRPTVYGDVRAIGRSIVPQVDVLVGGFPCQDLSVAGQRRGLSAERSGLFFQFVRLIRELRPRYFVIENVPGFLSSHRGLDFAVALGELDTCGYVGGWRVLDSQYFGLAQRRDRVFLVGGPRGVRDSAGEILFESEGREGDFAAGGEAEARVAATLRGRSHGAGVNAPGRGGEDDDNLIAYALRENERNTSQGPANYVAFDNRNGKDTETFATLRSDCHGANPMIAATLNSGGNDGGFRTEPGEHLIASSILARDANTRRDGMDNLVATGERARALVGSMFKRHDDDTDTLIAAPITASAGHHGHSSPRGDGRDNLVCGLHANQHGELRTSEQAGCLSSSRSGKQFEGVAYTLPSVHRGVGNGHNTTYPNGVRRLTPLECERLQGFPDGWTCLCGEGQCGSQFCSCSDTPRYKALGNAVSVPVAQWIAERILDAERRIG